MKNEDIIVTLLTEVRNDQKLTSRDISEIKLDVALNRQDLEEHMAQTRAVRELVFEVKNEAAMNRASIKAEADSRMSSIENRLTIGYLLKLIVTVATGLGAISGAIYGITRLF